MAKRRSDAEGSVYYSDARKCWVAQLDRDPLTNKRPLRTAKTEKEALELLRQMRAERSGGRDLSVKQPTLAAFLALWLLEVIKPNKKASTHDGYAQMCRLYIEPTLGRLRLEKLTPILIQRWVNDLARQGIGPATIRNAYTRLRSALDTAVTWRYLSHNPAVGITLPKLPRPIAKAYTLEQARKLLLAAQGWRQEALIWIMLLLGLRRGEALGLAWRDLDWETGTIQITQQVQLIDKKIVISPVLKTDSSRRTLPLTPGLVALLRHHWSEQQTERKAPGVDWKEHGLIFPSEVGTPLAPRNFYRAFEALCGAKRANVPVLRIHDLRHTCATLLGEQGEQEALIGALLGHTAANITRQYAHVGVEALRGAVGRLEQALSGDREDKAQEG